MEADVHEDVVTSIEVAGLVDCDALAAVRHALALDDVKGPHPERNALDACLGRGPTARFLMAAASGQPGVAVMSDREAMASHEGWDQVAFEALCRRAGRSSILALSPSFAGFAVAGMTLVVAVLVEGCGGHAADVRPLASCVAGCALGFAIGFLPLTFWGIFRRAPVRLARSLQVRERLDVAGSQAYAFGPEGITVLRVADGGVVRKDIPAPGIDAVRLSTVGPAHVSLAVSTAVGEVVVPWIRRERGVLDAILSWGVPVEGPA